MGKRLLCIIALIIGICNGFQSAVSFSAQSQRFLRLRSAQRVSFAHRRTRLHLRPPRGSKYVREGPGEPDYVDPYTEVPEYEIYEEGLGEHKNETFLYLGGRRAFGREYRPMKHYMGTLIPSEKLPDEEELPTRIPHQYPHVREYPFHTRRPVPFPMTPPFQVFLAMLNRTCQEDFEAEAAEKPPDAMIVARPIDGLYSTWDAVMLARLFGGDANEPSIQKHLEWGMPEHSPAQNMPFLTRFPATMTRDELLDTGQPLEYVDEIEREEFLEKIRNTYPEPPKPDISPAQKALEERLASDPEYHAQQARAAAAKKKKAQEKAARANVTSAFQWEPVMTTVEGPDIAPEYIRPKGEMPMGLFRARSLYEYTDWGDLQYQAEKRLFGDSSEEERMGFDRMNTEEYVEYYQNQPVETPQFVPVQQ